MKPTSLKHKISILDPVYIAGERGGQELDIVENWTTIAICRAAYRDLSGREFLAAQQMQSKLSGEFKIRYRSDIKASHKIIWGNRIFNISGPPRDIDGRKQWLFINVEELDNG